MTEASDEIEQLRAQVARLQGRVAELEREATAHRAMIDASADVILRFRPDLTCTYASPAIFEVLGYEPAEQLGRSGLSLIHPDDHDIPRALRERLLSLAPDDSTSRFGPYVSRVRHKDGRYIWVESMAALIRDPATGALQEFVLTSRDVDARVRAEADLRASEQRFRALIDALQVGVVVQGPNAEMLLFNQTALDVLGLTVEQISGRDSFDPRWAAVHEDGSPFPGEEHPVVVAMATCKPVHNVTMGVFHPPSETYVWLLVSATPQIGEDGRAYQVVCTFTDITARKQAEELLRDQDRLLDQLSSPIIPIADKVIALPLIGEVDARRASRVLEALLSGVTAHRARVALLDITGVSAADAAFASVLLQVTRGVRLLGAELVVTGMSPAVARTLVSLDVDLRGLVIRATLHDGVAFALARA